MGLWCAGRKGFGTDVSLLESRPRFIVAEFGRNLGPPKLLLRKGAKLRPRKLLLPGLTRFGVFTIVRRMADGSKTSL
jgi:hypothetical protein